MITLVVEASTYAGSTALLEGSRLLGERSVAMRGKEFEALMQAVGDLLSDCAVAPGQIARVVCGGGPGSFTSLRIAGSIAKGIAMAVGAELVPISSLALLVASLGPHEAGHFLACADAMRGESYVQTFELGADGRLSATSEQFVVPTSSVEEVAATRGARAVGASRSGADCVVPHARSAVRITNMIDMTPPADLASWEPIYGRLAEAQVKWEAVHGRPLAAG